MFNKTLCQKEEVQKMPKWQEEGYANYEEYWASEIATEHHLDVAIERAWRAFDRYEARDNPYDEKGTKLYEDYQRKAERARKISTIFPERDDVQGLP